MDTIAILTDSEEGHILPSFWLSRYLKTHNYNICYLVPSLAGNLVREQGFEFIPVLDDILSGGSRHVDPRLLNNRSATFHEVYFSSLVTGELLDRIIANVNPRAILVLSLYDLGGLAIRYRYGLPVVFFTPILRQHARTRECEILLSDILRLRSGVPELVELLTEAKINFKSIRDIAELALRIPELVLLPESFDLPGRVAEPRVHYVGAGVDLKRNEEPFSWDGIDSDRPVIYCARGSQVHAQRGPSRRFFQAAIDAAGARPDWQFIIAITKAFKIEEFGDVPPNVVLREWVPQLEVLSRASVMVHHGGFGTVKECLLIGVPMVSVPLIGFRDYRICTERIVHHGLGVQSDTDRITSSELVQLIAQVLNDQSFKRRVNLMREKFIQEDRLDIAVKVIEATISEIVGAASPDR